MRSASETNGTPPASSTLALDLTSAGTAGLFWMPVMNDVVRVAISTAPASAVPIDAPRLVTVFWRPPTSPLCSSGTDDTVTLPSCEASAPTPRPASSIGQVTISGPAPASSAADHDDDAGEQREEAKPDDPARRRVGEDLRDAGGGQQERDRERQQPDTGRDRREPERNGQEQRHREEQPGLQEILEEERGQAAAQRQVLAGSPGSRAVRRRERFGGSPSR